MKHSRKLIILIGCIAAFVVIAVVAIAMLATTTNGTEKYDGVRRQAAEFMLSSFDPWDDGIGTVPGFTKLSVASVEFTPKGSCTNVNEYKSYTVTLKTVSWFGITVDTKTDSICRMFASK